MIHISNSVELPDKELEWESMRSGGAGGQHVNKVSTAVRLSFDIGASSLPDFYKERLLEMNHHQITKEGVVVIKCADSRSQDSNREEALRKFVLLIRSATIVQKKRKATRPTKGSVKRRLDAKKRRGEKKNSRRKPSSWD